MKNLHDIHLLELILSSAAVCAQMLLGSAGILKGDDMRPFGNVNSVLVPRVKSGRVFSCGKIAKTMENMRKPIKNITKHTGKHRRTVVEPNQ